MEIKERIKKAKNFWYLQEEEKLLRNIWENVPFNKYGLKDSIYQELIDKIVEVRVAIENLIYVARKLPKDTSKNKELYFRGGFKKLCEFGDDILCWISETCEEYYLESRRKGNNITTDIKFNNFVYATSKRAELLNDLMIWACEE